MSHQVWVKLPQDLLMKLREIVVSEWNNTPIESDKAKYLHTLWTQIDAIRFPGEVRNEHP